MWKQFLKQFWLLIANTVLLVIAVTLFVWSSGWVTGETYCGSFSAIFCMAVLLVLSISCFGVGSSEVSGWYKILIFVNTVLALTVVTTNTYDGMADLSEFMYVLETINFACITFLSFFYWYYIQDEIGKEGRIDKPRLKRRKFLVNVVCIVSCALLVINRFGEYMYGIDDAGYYFRGPLFPVSWICPIFLFFMCFELIVIQRFELRWKAVHLSYPLLPLLMYPLQVLHEKMMPLNIAITIGLLLMYCVNYMNRGKELFRQKELIAIQEKEKLEMEQELYKMEVQLMISQIQPHFLYNTIAMIRGLCREDADAAAQALGSFSKFLRGSLHMMQKTECISIEDELKLVYSYMDLEQKRFGDRLEYVEDVEDVHFELPALTIEPLLENAIHHGIEEKEEGGTVTLIVTEDEENYIIQITDDGAGFDTSIPIDGKKHIGIGNVKTRLEKMCNGSLEFESEIGVETTATVKIPKRNQGYELRQEM